MRYSAILAGGLSVLGILTMGAQCSDPGNPKTGGKPHHFTATYHDGSVITKESYGLYHANTTGPEKSPLDCRWTVTLKGKVVASGGVYDKIIAGSGLKGGVVHLHHCKLFWKQF